MRTIKVKASSLFQWAITALFALCFSRGIIELLSSKNIGYLLGVVALFLISFFMLIASFQSGKFHIKKTSKIPLYFACAYTFFALASFLFTALTGGNFLVATLYFSIHLYLVFSIILIINAKYSIKFDSLAKTSLVVGMIILVSGALDYAGIVEFPGAWTYREYTRLSGSLGSKQHYSFASAGFSLLLLFIYIENNNKIYLVSSILLALLSFLSFSRMGYPLIIGTFFLYLFSNITRLITKAWKLSLAGLSLLVILTIFAPEITSSILERVSSTISFGEVGNSVRFEAWNRGLTAFTNSPIYFGDNVGLYSQSGARLELANSAHFESGVIQQFVNFGLWGGTFFILFFISYIYQIRNHFLKCVACMVFCTYFYYPGTEVIPIIAFWILLSMLDSNNRSNSIGKVDKKTYSPL